MPSKPRPVMVILIIATLTLACSALSPGISEPSTPGSGQSLASASPLDPTAAPTVVGDLMGHPGPGDWPAYGLDPANSVHNVGEHDLSPETVGRLGEAWHLETGGVTATPVVIAGIAYFGDWLGTVRAVDARTGAVAWEQTVTDAPISASTAVTDELVISGDLAGGLHALRRTDGSIAWSTTVDPIEASLFASPVVIGDMVVIGMTDTELSPSDDPEFRCAIVAFNLVDGTERWRRFTDPDDSPGKWVTVWSSAAYDAERELIFVGTGNTNQAAGRGSEEDAVESLPLADGVLAIEAETGEIDWFSPVVLDDRGRDLDIGASPNLFRIGDRDVVGVGGKSGDYVALDRDTGELIWKQHLTAGSAGGGVMQTAAVGDGRTYVASNDGGSLATIFALDTATGAIEWQQPMDSAVYGGSMALANGVLYRGLWNGGLVALDASDGSELWRRTGYAPLAGGAAVADGMLYAGYGSGQPGNLRAPTGGVVAFGLP